MKITPADSKNDNFAATEMREIVGVVDKGRMQPSPVLIEESNDETKNEELLVVETEKKSKIGRPKGRRKTGNFFVNILLKL